MKSNLCRFLAAVLLLGVSVSVTAQDNARPASSTSIVYPQTRTVEHADDYFGTKVADPYRWMEDLNSPEVKQWIEEENKVTFGYLDTIPQRHEIKKRLEQVWNFERYSPPMKRGSRYFYSKNDGLQNQAVLYVADSFGATPRVLLDPNKLSQDGTVALGPHAITDAGKLMAYAIQTAGSDWEEWRVRDVATGQDLPDHIVWSKFSGASWTKDGSGFFYSAYDPPKQGTALSGENYYQKLYFHKLGTPQAQDLLVYQTPEHKDWGFGGAVTDDGHYLVVYISQGTDQRNRVYYKDLTDPKAPVVKLLDDFDAQYEFVDNDGPVFWFRTDNSAPMYRLIAIDTRHPEKANWKEILPQGKDTLEAVSAIDNKFVAQYLQDAHSAVRIYDLTGKHLRDLPLPGIGSVAGANG
ncbi:MAG: S9 family peptidase, partial [Terriglobales bacterium]